MSCWADSVDGVALMTRAHTGRRPLDVLVERDPAPLQVGLVAWQVCWAALLLFTCHRVQRRAERRLVVQGG